MNNYPIKKYNNQGNQIYYENSNGFWSKWNYNNQSNIIYYENSNGFWKKGFQNKKTNQLEGIIIKNYE